MTYPLYHFEDRVQCDLCDGDVGKARDGDVIGFGDGNGNRELPCSCSRKVIFDVTKSRDKAEQHARLHDEEFRQARIINRRFFKRDQRPDDLANEGSRVRSSEGVAGQRPKPKISTKRSTRASASCAAPTQKPGGMFAALKSKQRSTSE